MFGTSAQEQLMVQQLSGPRRVHAPFAAEERTMLEHGSTTTG